MKLYSAIDLHSNNHVLTVIDEQDRRVYERRLGNDLTGTLRELEPYREQLVAVAVESTFNWYWLVDGLMQAGYEVRLVNTSAVRTYEGLKHTDDQHDAFWLAHLLRLGILPCGYIYPKEQRGLRDLARQRVRLVQHRSALLLSLQNQLWRSTAIKVCGRDLQDRSHSGWPQFSDENLQASVHSIEATVAILGEQIDCLQKRILQQVRLTPIFQALYSVPGIGPILALTIMLEVGDIHRFAGAGHFASYCRCVRSERLSNGKKKGENNRKCGNAYLAWAFLEAAHFAVRYLPAARRFYERKSRERNKILAIKALAHKIARACYFVMRDQVPFEPRRLFAS